MTEKELVEKLEKVGIKGEWVCPDEYGFSRLFQFEVDGQTMKIEWYCNYSTLMVGNVHSFFDSITNSHYPHKGKWIEFSFRGKAINYLKVGE